MSNPPAFTIEMARVWNVACWLVTRWSGRFSKSAMSVACSDFIAKETVNINKAITSFVLARKFRPRPSATITRRLNL
jgi:hypothetical protein